MICWCGRCPQPNCDISAAGKDFDNPPELVCKCGACEKPECTAPEGLAGASCFMFAQSPSLHERNMSICNSQPFTPTPAALLQDTNYTYCNNLSGNVIAAADVLCVIEDHRLPVHSQFLAASTDFLCDVLANTVPTCRTSKPLVIKEPLARCSLQAVDAFLEHAYNRGTHMEPDAAWEILNVASQLDCAAMLEKAKAAIEGHCAKGQLAIGRCDPPNPASTRMPCMSTTALPFLEAVTACMPHMSAPMPTTATSAQLHTEAGLQTKITILT